MCLYCFVCRCWQPYQLHWMDHFFLLFIFHLQWAATGTPAEREIPIARLWTGRCLQTTPQAAKAQLHSSAVPRPLFFFFLADRRPWDLFTFLPGDERPPSWCGFCPQVPSPPLLPPPARRVLVGGWFPHRRQAQPQNSFHVFYTIQPFHLQSYRIQSDKNERKQS